VLSVTSDVSASATYQNAPPKPALPDPAQLASSFSDLVDSNLQTSIDLHMNDAVALKIWIEIHVYERC